MRLVLAFGLILVAACSHSTSPAPVDLVGDWSKLEKNLPPIDLTVTRNGDVLSGRLRLSGAESNGTVTLNGSHIRVTFTDSREPMEGDIVSATDLDVKLSASGQSYRLHKLN